MAERASRVFEDETASPEQQARSRVIRVDFGEDAPRARAMARSHPVDRQRCPRPVPRISGAMQVPTRRSPSPAASKRGWSNGYALRLADQKIATGVRQRLLEPGRVTSPFPSGTIGRTRAATPIRSAMTPVSLVQQEIAVVGPVGEIVEGGVEAKGDSRGSVKGPLRRHAARALPSFSSRNRVRRGRAGIRPSSSDGSASPRSRSFRIRGCRPSEAAPPRPRRPSRRPLR